MEKISNDIDDEIVERTKNLLKVTPQSLVFTNLYFGRIIGLISWSIITDVIFLF